MSRTASHQGSGPSRPIHEARRRHRPAQPEHDEGGCHGVEGSARRVLDTDVVENAAVMVLMLVRARSCSDYHATIKMIANVYVRNIVPRDANCFYHLTDIISAGIYHYESLTFFFLIDSR
jgi:hypothetical protein